MNSDKIVREPKQTRSIKMKNNIIQSAYDLFCEKGYYKTTTNEIAKCAGVSIGSLYSYFADKDEILFEILDVYYKEFSNMYNDVDIFLNDYLYKKDRKLWIRNLINYLINLHKSRKELAKELDSLYHTKIEVKRVVDERRKRLRSTAFKYFDLFKDDFRFADIDVIAIIVVSLTESIVRIVVFEETSIESERLIDATVEAIYRFLTL